jgi:long-chain acyl-CoA synthetase
MNRLLATLAARTPDDVIVDEGQRSLTAGRLLADIEAIRTALIADGIGRLGLLAGNSAAWITTDLACQFANICLLPMPTFFADEQLSHSVQSVGLDAVLTDDPQRIKSLLGVQMTSTRFTSGLTLLRFTGMTRATLPPGTQKITFTSGSTGTPRGVCLGVEQQLRVADALDQALRLQKPRHLCLLPLSTLLENVGGNYYPLLAGGTLIVPPEADTGFSGTTGLNILCLLRAIDRHRPTSIILLPQMLVGLVAALEEGWRPPVELEFAAVGGAKVAEVLLRRARERGLPAYEGYGLSETASVACLNFPGDERMGSTGRPLSHVEVRIESGEVMISGNNFSGYVDDPDSWGVQTVATGDLGEQDADGYVFLRGRRSNLMISSFGRNISPEWIESELMCHAGIHQCVVVGDDRPYCTALIATADPDTADRTIQTWIDAVNAKLPDYARVQRWSRLAGPLEPADGLYTENGRPRRAAIAERFADQINSLYSESAGAEPVRTASQ